MLLTSLTCVEINIYPEQFLLCYSLHSYVNDYSKDKIFYHVTQLCYV